MSGTIGLSILVFKVVETPARVRVKAAIEKRLNLRDQEARAIN